MHSNINNPVLNSPEWELASEVVVGVALRHLAQSPHGTVAVSLLLHAHPR